MEKAKKDLWKKHRFQSILPSDISPCDLTLILVPDKDSLSFGAQIWLKLSSDFLFLVL